MFHENSKIDQSADSSIDIGTLTDFETPEINAIYVMNRKLWKNQKGPSVQYPRGYSQNNPHLAKFSEMIDSSSILLSLR